MVFPACIMSDPVTDNIGNSFSFDSRITLYPFGFGLNHTIMTGSSSHNEALQKVDLEIVKKKSGLKPG